MAYEILTEMFLYKERNFILQMVQGCMIEVLKLSCMAQKLYLVWDEKYEFKRNLKISCSLHYSKKTREWLPKYYPRR